MRLCALLIVLATGCAPTVHSPQVLDQAATDPLSRAAQIETGRQLFLSQCSACHGAGLEGRYGSPLSGPRFQSNWRGRQASELQIFIGTNMPVGLAGTLTSAQTLAITAYLLHANAVATTGAAFTSAALEDITLFKP